MLIRESSDAAEATQTTVHPKTEWTNAAKLMMSVIMIHVFHIPLSENQIAKKSAMAIFVSV